MYDVRAVRYVIGCILLSSVLHGCGASDNVRPNVTVRDSADVRIVESDPSGSTSFCEFAGEPDVDIGAVDAAPEYQLFRVADATRLPDGRIAVVNAGSHEVRLYDRDGRYLLAFGREGDGPGEFRLPVRVWSRADSLVVYDARRQRLNWFTTDDAFVRDVALAPRYMNPPQFFLLSDGRAIAVDHVFTVSPSGFAEQPLYVILHREDGQATDTLGRYSYGQMGSVGPPGATIVTGPLFQAQTRAVASHDRIYIARGHEREIEVLRLDGSLEDLIRWSGPERSVSEEDVRRYRESELARAETSGQQALIRRRLEDRPVSDRFPALDELKTDEAGRLWVREYERPTTEQRRQWLVFGEDGAFACRVQLPEQFEVLEIGADYVLGLWRDEFDVEHVRVHQFVVDANAVSG